eukprot:ctg_1766.g537
MSRPTRGAAGAAHEHHRICRASASTTGAVWRRCVTGAPDVRFGNIQPAVHSATGYAGVGAGDSAIRECGGAVGHRPGWHARHSRHPARLRRRLGYRLRHGTASRRRRAVDGGGSESATPHPRGAAKFFRRST